MEPRCSVSRFSKIRHEPGRIRCRCCRQLWNNNFKLVVIEAIEHEVRDDQVITRLVQRAGLDVLVQKPHAQNRVWHFFRHPAIRHLQHARTGIDAIDVEFRLRPHKLNQETSVPLAHDERALSVVSLILCAIYALGEGRYVSLGLSLALSALFLLLLQIGGSIRHDERTALADLVLLTPVLFLVFRTIT